MYWKPWNIKNSIQMMQHNVCILVIFVVLVPYIRMNSQFSAIVCVSQNLYYMYACNPYNYYGTAHFQF